MYCICISRPCPSLGNPKCPSAPWDSNINKTQVWGVAQWGEERILPYFKYPCLQLKSRANSRKFNEIDTSMTLGHMEIKFQLGRVNSVYTVSDQEERLHIANSTIIKTGHLLLT